MALTDSQKSSIESKKNQIESQKKMIEGIKSTVKNGKEHLRDLIKSSTQKTAKEQYRKNLANNFKYAEGQIENHKKSIERLKEDIQNIKSK
jgi:uncharacterized protein YydD (DUF2326 family)